VIRTEIRQTPMKEIKADIFSEDTEKRSAEICVMNLEKHMRKMVWCCYRYGRRDVE